jgi:glutamine synthetase type III
MKKKKSVKQGISFSEYLKREKDSESGLKSLSNNTEGKENIKENKNLEILNKFDQSDLYFFN